MDILCIMKISDSYIYIKTANCKLKKVFDLKSQDEKVKGVGRKMVVMIAIIGLWQNFNSNNSGEFGANSF